jgi:hypothetical protein
LRALLDEVKTSHQSGITNYVSSHDEMRQVGQVIPDCALGCGPRCGTLVYCSLTAEVVRKLGVALDAAYRYAAWIRQELKNSTYQCDECSRLDRWHTHAADAVVAAP